MEKLDLRKQYKALYNPPSKAPVIVDVPPLNYLMIDGAGDPNTTAFFQEAMMALYSAAYTLKFMVKMGPQQIDYPVMALEGLWWAADMAAFRLDARADWQWTLLIMQPEFIIPALVAQAVEQASRKRPNDALARIRLDCYEEGRAAQIMHIGPYAAEAPTIEKLHQFIADSGYRLRGKHHEIYMGDPRRTAPERLKTVIRQPIA